MYTSAAQLAAATQQLANPDIAAHSLRFFRTGPGEYGEGDRFLGIRVPALRQLVSHCRTLPLTEITLLLQSPWHEQRLLALLILVDQFKRGDQAHQGAIYKLYLSQTHYINNWDLVDVSASQIVGAWLAPCSRQPLKKLARSNSLWQRRIAIIATFHFIRLNQFDDTLEIAKILVKDGEDLIHKAVGWMLRELGKRNLQLEETFLARHYHEMPRTMLRYAIEKFPEARRQDWLHGRMRLLNNNEDNDEYSLSVLPG